MIRIARFVHRRILLLLIGSYILAAVVPTAGAALRELRWDLGAVGVLDVPQAMLAALLFLSAMAASPALMIDSWKHPRALAAAVIAKIVVPPLAVLAIMVLVRFAGAEDAVAPLIVGLVILAAMPVASSAPAWTQEAGGNVALALGILVASLFAGPFAGSLWAPRLVDWQATGAPVPMAPLRAATYFLGWIVAPSVAGMLVRYAIGDQTFQRLRPHVGLASVVLLLALIYAFAAAALDDLTQRGDGMLVVWSFALSGALCVLLFALGWGLGRFLRFDRPSRITLTYAVGMHNNGVAMLIGAEFLPTDSPIFLPMISYALCQHMLAALVDSSYQRSAGANPAPAQ